LHCFFTATTDKTLEGVPYRCSKTLKLRAQTSQFLK
jgi:hypothetical protein